MVFSDLTRKFEGLDDNDLVVFISDDFMYYQYCLNIIGSMVMDFNRSGVIVILNKHSKDFLVELKKRNIPCDNLWFVDCVSVLSGDDVDYTARCLVVNHPINYHDILIGIKKSFKLIKKNKKRFVMFISPHIITAYVNVNEAGMFFQQVKSYLKSEKVLDIIMLEKEDNKTFENEIVNLSDTVLTT